jgi:hypothetical protein
VSCLFVFWQYWGLNLGPSACKEDTLPLKPSSQSFYVFAIFSTFDLALPCVTILLSLPSEWLGLQAYATMSGLVLICFSKQKHLSNLIMMTVLYNMEPLATRTPKKILISTSFY